MKFGYFTLSDNHYDNNSRSPNQFVADIIDEALYAETLASYATGETFPHEAAEGFIRLASLEAELAAARARAVRV